MEKENRGLIIKNLSKLGGNYWVLLNLSKRKEGQAYDILEVWDSPRVRRGGIVVAENYLVISRLENHLEKGTAIQLEIDEFNEIENSEKYTKLRKKLTERGITELRRESTYFS